MRFIVSVIMFFFSMAIILFILGASAGIPEILIAAVVAGVIAYFGSRLVVRNGHSS